MLRFVLSRLPDDPRSGMVEVLAHLAVLVGFAEMFRKGNL
jgi:hypothetical protein